MAMTIEQKQQHPIASRIPMELWHAYCVDFPEHWESNSAQSSSIASLKRQDLPESPLQALIVLMVINNNSANDLISYALNELQVGINDIFYLSSTMGYTNILDSLTLNLSANITDEMKHQVFIDSCSSGSLKTAEWLVKIFPDQSQAMIEANDYYAFRIACSNDHLKLAKWLIKTFPDQSQAMIKADDYYAFRESSYCGNFKMVKWLVETFPNQSQAMVDADNYYSFRFSCRNGHFKTAKWLIKTFPDQSQAMIKADDYYALDFACCNGHIDIVRWLNEIFPDQIHAMIKRSNYEVFQNSHNNGHLEIAKQLLSDTKCFIYAELDTNKYTFVINDYIDEMLTSLKERFEVHDDIEQPFDLLKQEATHIFYVLRNLINQNKPENHDNIMFLLNLPAIQSLAHQKTKDGGEPNQLLNLALSLNNQEVAVTLFKLPEVRELFERDNPKDTNQLGLKAQARNLESALHRLSDVELQHLEKAYSRYQPMLEKIGEQAIIDKLKNMLIERYKANPASIKGIILPVDYQAFQNLKLTAEQTEKALKKYYQHPDHTAYRYLSKPNHWIHDSAAFTYTNKAIIGCWSNFEKYLSDIALHYLAATDEYVEAIDGHTLEGRITHFVKEIALIGRAHNWDKRQLYNEKKGLFREYDDLQGDRPSCTAGVRRRLFQSVIGHIDFTTLTAEMLHEEIRFFVFTYYQDKLSDATFSQLFTKIYQHISNSPELFSDKYLDFLRDANIPQNSIDAFETTLEQKYGDSYSKIPQYKNLFNDTFSLIQLNEETFHLINLGFRAGIFDKLQAKSSSQASISSNQQIFFAKSKPDSGQDEINSSLNSKIVESSPK